MLFCIVYSGLNPRLANERLEAGENRLEKIISLAKGSKYSVHDLSRAQCVAAGEFVRMNMPFELGLDFGIRRTAPDLPSPKKFLILEKKPYDTQRALSDLAGQDLKAHGESHEDVIRITRDFIRVEAKIDLAGAAQITSDYRTFQAWVLEKKISEGHSEADALRLPTAELLESMRDWVLSGSPAEYIPPP